MIDEFVLRRLIGGPKVMRTQLRKIVAESEWPNVRVRVLPASAGAHPGLDGTFAIYEFAALETYVYLENRKGGIFVTDGNDTQQYVESRDALWDVALGEEESGELIDALAEGLNDD